MKTPVNGYNCMVRNDPVVETYLCYTFRCST